MASQRESLMRANLGGTCRLSRRVEKQQQGQAARLGQGGVGKLQMKSCTERKDSSFSNYHNRCASVPTQRVIELEQAAALEQGGDGNGCHNSQGPGNNNGNNCLPAPNYYGSGVGNKRPSNYRRPSYCPPPLCRAETDDYSADYLEEEREPLSNSGRNSGGGGREREGDGCSTGRLSPRPTEPSIVVDTDAEQSPGSRRLSATTLTVCGGGSGRGIERESKSLVNLCDEQSAPVTPAAKRKSTECSLPQSPNARLVQAHLVQATKPPYHSQPHLNVAPLHRMLPMQGAANHTHHQHHLKSPRTSATSYQSSVSPRNSASLPPNRYSSSSSQQPLNLLAKAHQHYQANGPGKALRGSKEKIVYLRERKALKTIGIVVLGFVICWLPFFVVYLMEVFMRGVSRSYSFQLLNEFFLWLGYSNSSLNPLIYTMYNGDFRRCFRDLLGCGCMQHHRRTMSVKKLHQQSTLF